MEIKNEKRAQDMANIRRKMVSGRRDVKWLMEVEEQRSKKSLRSNL